MINKISEDYSTKDAISDQNQAIKKNKLALVLDLLGVSALGFLTSRLQKHGMDTANALATITAAGTRLYSMMQLISTTNSLTKTTNAYSIANREHVKALGQTVTEENAIYSFKISLKNPIIRSIYHNKKFATKVKENLLSELYKNNFIGNATIKEDEIAIQVDELWTNNKRAKEKESLTTIIADTVQIPEEYIVDYSVKTYRF